ncbi:MAG TPA: triple tyrosine motif-containing protein, partial [Ignavibacteriaceae bacterium]
TSLNKIFGSVYVSTEERGILKLENGLLVKSRLALPDSTMILFSAQYEKKHIVGTVDNRVFVSGASGRLKELHLEDANYANASEIINATWINAESVALGTLRGGVIFINPVTGKTAEIINYNKGLPDNEVYTLIGDRNQNVWAAHAYGFTRIAPQLPMRSFRYYPGLQGNLLCATTFRGNVYVGTSLGLFKLEREEFYDEITYYVDVLVKPRIRTKSKKPVAPIQEVKKEEPEKGGFFKFLRKKKPEPITPAKVTTPKPVKSTKPKPRYRKEKRTKRILRSTYYGYKKVEGIDAKVTQLVSWQNKLLAAGLDGVFEVNQLQSVPVIESPVRFLFASESKRILIASTYDDKLHQLTTDKNGWKDQDKIQNINDPINYIFEEKGAAVWFCSFEKIYRLEYSKDTTVVKSTLNIVNPSFDKTAGISLKDQVVIATSTGFYFYDKNKDELIKADTLSKPNAFFANGSRIWFRDEHQWFLTSNARGQANLQLLNLFNDIRYISTDEGTGNVWIITGDNELFRFYSEKLRSLETTYPLFLKYIGQNDAVRFRKSSLEIDQENSSLKIEVIKPDYIGASAVEYRYFLQGLNTEWSGWSNNNNVIDFPYLPPGAYTLQFQSKDIFGKVSEMDPVKVNVLPPYWKRTWFYALEFAVFMSLVFLSFRLSNRYSLISRLLSLLSIIILIEFIQTAAGSTFTTNSGPVVDFLIQVCVAFLILPVEGFLRKFMLKSIEKKAVS